MFFRCDLGLRHEGKGALKIAEPKMKPPSFSPMQFSLFCCGIREPDWQDCTVWCLPRYMTARLARLYLQLYVYESQSGKIEAQFKFTTEDAGCPLCRLSDTDRMTGNVRLHCTPKGNTHIERRATVAITQRGQRGGMHLSSWRKSGGPSSRQNG